MTYRFMRIIDDSIGIALCRLIGIFLKIKKKLFPAKPLLNRADIKRILIQKYFGMGSILQASRLITALRENYPGASITFITIESNKEIISLCALSDSILLVDFKSPVAFIKSFLNLFKTLIDTRFDISIDLEFFAKFPLLVAAISGADVKVGLFHRKIRPNGILTHKVTFNFYRHISQIYLAYADVLGLKIPEQEKLMSLPSLRQDLESNIRLRFNLRKQELFIIINVNSGDLFSFRKWPEHHFVTLLTMLLKRHPSYKYLLIGSSSEYSYVDHICQQIGKENSQLLNCSGQTSLKELFALIEMSELVITNDSGPLHIASLYRKNLAVFFGPETPVVYGPRNSNSIVFYPDNLFCSPCMCVYDSKQSLYAETCETNICLSSIPPEQVLVALEDRFLGLPEKTR